MQLETAVAIIPSAQLAGLFDPLVEGGLSANERALISVLVSNDAKSEMVLPDSISDSDLWDALQVCCKVESRVRKVQTVLKMLVGRALLLMQNRPTMYKERGFISLDAIMSDQERGLPMLTGISRAELYNAKSIAKSWPTISQSDAVEIGFTKLVTLAKIRKQSDSDSGKWLEVAKTSTNEGLIDAIYRSNNGVPNGSLEVDTLTLTLSKSEKDEILEFLNNPAYQAYCKTKLPGIMLTQVIAESVAEWNVQIRAEEDR